MLDYEKKIFRGSILVGVLVGGVSLGLSFLLRSETWATVSMMGFFTAGMFGFIWFVKACIDSLKDHGFGEGVANLYGEERAKWVFGEDYKPSEKTDDQS